MEKNNWEFDVKNESGECFAHWFTNKFGVDTSWQHGDESSEEDEPTDDHPYRTGTYIGTLEGGDKKYTVHGVESFRFKILYAEKGKLKDRKGCDLAGHFGQSGS